VTLTPPAVTIGSLTIAPPSLIGSNDATGTIALTAPAPALAIEVELLSSDPAVTVPSVVQIASGQSQATFPIATSVVALPTSVTITATHAATTKSALFTLQPPAGNSVSSVSAAPRSVTLTANYGGVLRRLTIIVAPQNAVTLTSFTINPARVIGGNQSSGTIVLSGPAPFGGAAVAVSAKRRNMVTVPAIVLIPEGATTATFAIATDPIHGNRDRSVEIDATYNGITQSATLTIAPPLTAGWSLGKPIAKCASLALEPCLTAAGLKIATHAVSVTESRYSFYTPELQLDVWIATGVGAVAGALAPYTAVTYLGAMATGAAANFAQYGLTEAAHDRSLDINGAGAAALTGAVGGFVGGPVSRAGAGWSEDVISPAARAQFRELNNNSNVRRAGGDITRSLLGSVASNLQEGGCGCR
jgi:hypothetical protein